MTMFYIVLLIFFGLLFLVAELVLLPGVSIGAILALVCYGSSHLPRIPRFGPVAGSVVVLVILVLVARSPPSFRCAPRRGSASRSNRKSIRRACLPCPNRS